VDEIDDQDFFLSFYEDDEMPTGSRVAEVGPQIGGDGFPAGPGRRLPRRDCTTTIQQRIHIAFSPLSAEGFDGIDKDCIEAGLGAK
jgi:hypothetical protein